MKKIVFILLIPILVTHLKGATIYSTGNGSWNSSSSWLRNGMASLPACGDTIYVETNTTVTVNSQESYTGCSAPLYLFVKGTLQFTNGNKLDLKCGSLVSVLSGGTIKKATAGGGNSTLISICNDILWNAGMGSLTGPVYLPVSLLSFEVKAQDDHVLCNWSTATEINNDYFIIQRSRANSLFTNICMVNGAGNSNFILNYSAMDATPPPGFLYYRLGQVDFNGNRSYYSPVAVSIKKNHGMLVFPNPVTDDHVSVFINSEANAIYTLYVEDIEGKILFKKEDRCEQKGINTILLNNTRDFAPGTYFISLNINDAIYQEKMIIR